MKSLCIVLCLAATSAAAEEHYPPFTWDTVPVYLHFGKRAAPLTEAELRFVAETCDFVTLEKAHALDALGSTEKGIAHDAARLKALNPELKALFYWNTFLNYALYDACDVVEEHPEWLFRDTAGAPIYKTGTLEQYNLLDPEFRAWWATVAGAGVKQYGCDGIFMDAVNQAKRPVWMKRGWGEGKEGALTEAVIDMMRRAREAMGQEGLLLYNGVRSTDASTTGGEYSAHADGFTIEHFGAFASQSKEAMLRDIDAMAAAGSEGKIVLFKGWPAQDFNWTNREKMRLPAAQLAEEAREAITFSMACFLAGAERHAYFCYSWGYRDDHGNLLDYGEYKKPLGAPRGGYRREGWVLRRDFEHARVEVNLETRGAVIDWEK